MVVKYINPNEIQYGLRNCYVDQQNLNGISVGSNDCIIEYVLSNYEQDMALSVKGDAAEPDSYLLICDNAITSLIGVLNVRYGAYDYGFRVLGIGPNWSDDRRLGFISGQFHAFIIVKELTYRLFVNGHEVFNGAKTAHNYAFQRVRMPNDAVIGGVAAPSTVYGIRVYSIPPASTPTDAQLLTIHQKWLRFPLITPTELSAYEIFRFRARRQDGTQIPPADTNIYNEINGDALSLNGGLATWAYGRKQIWVPR